LCQFEVSRKRLRLGRYELNTGLVSVIIPAFNAPVHIRQTLNSVLSQTYEALEVIVVDDGSLDETGAIVEEFVKADPRVQLVRQRNAGVGAARNAAIRRARGEYIAPLDADDFWLPEKLEKQVFRMVQSGSKTGLVYCWYELIDEQGEPVGNGYSQTAEGHLRDAMVLRNLVGNASAPLIRATALAKVGVYLTREDQGGAQGCEDWDLHLRIAEHFSIRVVPEYLLAYRQTASSMSADATIMAASFTVVLGRARERNPDLPSSLFRWSAAYFYLYLVQKCKRWGHYASCLSYLEKAVRADPALLLTTGIYRTFISSLLRAILTWNPNHLAKQGWPLSIKAEERIDSSSRAERKRPFISNRIFENIERRRWAAALQAGN
jgi:glycosyltransferase involved in cell wall biosynthesis